MRGMGLFGTILGAIFVLASQRSPAAPVAYVLREYPVPAGSHPHDVAPAADGGVWYTAQTAGALGHLDPVTGQSGVYGRLDPKTGKVEVLDASRGRGPYGICTTPSGSVYYASLAGNYIARVDLTTGWATILEPPTPRQGPRRVWADSKGRLWVSEWNAGQVGMYDPGTDRW